MRSLPDVERPSPRGRIWRRVGRDDAIGVAVTGVGSALDKTAIAGGWLARFPMWDWIGGRTSVMSAVGLVPLWLQGLEMQSLLDGAAAMDVWKAMLSDPQSLAQAIAHLREGKITKAGHLFHLPGVFPHRYA